MTACERIVLASLLVAGMTAGCESASSTGANGTPPPGGARLTFLVTIDPGSVEDVSGGPDEDFGGLPLLDTPLWISFQVGEDGGASAWVQLEPNQGAHAAGATGPFIPGSLAPLTFHGEYAAFKPIYGWFVDSATLSLTAHDADDDGVADRLSGTLSAEAHVSHGDVGASMSFKASVTGVALPAPATITPAWVGSWPELRAHITATRPIDQTAVAAAVDHLVDGQKAAFTIVPSGAAEGPEGASTDWVIEPVVPYSPGANVTVSVAALQDISGFMTNPVEKSSVQVPALTGDVVDADWDFSAGSPFTSEEAIGQVVPSFGSVAAPSGGAMALLPLFDESQFARWTWTTPVALPEDAHEVSIDIALVWTDVDAPGVLEPDASLLTGAGTVTVPLVAALKSATQTEVEGQAYEVESFKTISLDATGMGGQTGLIRLRVTGPIMDVQFPPVGTVHLLVDAIRLK